MLNSWSATQLTFHSPEPMQRTFCPDIPHPFLSIRPTPQRIKTTLTTHEWDIKPAFKNQHQPSAYYSEKQAKTS